MTDNQADVALSREEVICDYQPHPYPIQEHHQVSDPAFVTRFRQVWKQTI